MNGSENGYAGALFFALVSLGAILKFDDVIGLFVGAAGALFAALSLRRALVKSAQATEEDHQRIEIQLQQLRRKVSETSSVNAAAMSSVNDVAQIVQENLQVMRVRLGELDNLSDLARNTEGIRSTLASLEENSAAFNVTVEKFLSAVAAQEKTSDSTALVVESFGALAEEVKLLNETSAANKHSLQTVLKLLQLVGQVLKNPAYAKNLDNISSSVETISTRTTTLDALKNSVDDAQKNLAELVRINTSLAKNFSSTLDDLRFDVAKLSAKLEAINASDSHAALTSQDINLLKKIAAKINLK
ncbi:MAG: hypothetical protein IJ774_02160 [Selenomonadaceae bacterium]|nr:hypothetical protein [Selenomonadaceae bacterium]